MADRAQPGGREPASGSLALVQDFVNTVDLEDGPDTLETVAGLREFLRSARLLSAGANVTERDRLDAVALREALRALALANNGAAPDRTAIDELNHFAESLPMVAQFGPGGEARLAPTRSGVAASLAAILAAVYDSIAEGSWARLKACRNPDCRWVFYDRSKNRSGRWCAMATCGSRVKAREYSRRRRRD